MADVDELIAELKKRDMKLMMDLVVNHTSDQVSLSFSVFISVQIRKNREKRQYFNIVFYIRSRKESSEHNVRAFKS